MKKIIFSLFIILGMAALSAQEQHIIAVTPFDLIGGFNQDDADVIYELLITELVRCRGIEVVDRDSFETVRTQVNFQNSDWSDTDRVTEFGRALNVNYIIRGQKMILSGKYIISARIVDINTSMVMFDTPLQLNGLDELFGHLPVYVTSMVETLFQPQRDFRVGDAGPGGGIIFFAEDGRYMEYSGELGRFRWNDAMTAAKNHRGGGFSDWYLPTRNELDLLYRSTRENRLAGISYDWYWSSSEITDNSAWYRNFSGGRQGSASKTSPFRVLAIRVF